MASQGPNNTHNAAIVPGQAQMRRDDLLNQQSDIHNQGQGTNYLGDTGMQVKNMAQGAADIGKGAAQGAADIGKGAAQGAVNLARGAAAGASNMAHGAAGAVKNTLGMNPADNPATGQPPWKHGWRSWFKQPNKHKPSKQPCRQHHHCHRQPPWQHEQHSWFKQPNKHKPSKQP
ncbi:Uncharacterized protein Adt_00270 [Abeliophyllum distichum]|uniref:Uncharacterized protein n=1 Tax=Abeliophyllum distichum TaxID=126358 RepID=A0ABD1VPL2_9LAMI